jgi:hypothetical protein
LVHGPHPGGFEPTAFVTKRISATLSEGMVTNIALNGFQKNLFSLSPEGVVPRTDLFWSLLENLDCIVTNTCLLSDGVAVFEKPEAVLRSAVVALDPERVLLFPLNPNSALVAEKRKVTTPEESEKLALAFSEEAATLELAARLTPCELVGMQNFTR